MEAHLAAILAGPSASDIIRERLPATLTLDGVALILAVAIYAAIAAVVSAEADAGENVIRVLRPLSMAIPAFVLGLVLQEIFGVQMHLLPVYGIVSPDTTGFSSSAVLFDHILHLLLPALTLSLASVGVTLAVAASRDFDLRRSWPRLVVFGLGAVLGGTFVVEPIFAWPGIGSVALQAAQLGPDGRSVFSGCMLVVVVIYVVLALLVAIGGGMLSQQAGASAESVPSTGMLSFSAGGGNGGTSVVVMAVAGMFVLLVVLAALIGPQLSPSSAYYVNLPNQFGPSQPGHLLGFDDLGRDELARLIAAARAPFGLGLLATIVAALVGTGLGVVLGLAAQAESAVAAIIEVIVSVLCGFPALVVALVLAVILPAGTFTLALVIALPAIQLFVRHASGLTGPSSAATTATDTPAGRLQPLIAQLPVALALAILMESVVSFLGLGVQPPDLDWGLMMTNAQEYMVSDMALLYLPALALGGTVLALVAFGEALRARLG